MAQTHFCTICSIWIVYCGDSSHNPHDLHVCRSINPVISPVDNTSETLYSCLSTFCTCLRLRWWLIFSRWSHLWVVPSQACKMQMTLTSSCGWFIDSRTLNCHQSSRLCGSYAERDTLRSLIPASHTQIPLMFVQVRCSAPQPPWSLIIVRKEKIIEKGKEWVRQVKERD